MNRNRLPHLLGSKIVGEEVAIASIARATNPHLGNLALGIADRNGNPLAKSGQPALNSEVESDDVAELNGQTPVAPITFNDSPEVQAAVAKLDAKKSKADK